MEFHRQIKLFSSNNIYYEVEQEILKNLKMFGANEEDIGIEYG